MPHHFLQSQALRFVRKKAGMPFLSIVDLKAHLRTEATVCRCVLRRPSGPARSHVGKDHDALFCADIGELDDGC